MSTATPILQTEGKLTLYADGGTIGGSPGRAVYWSVGTREWFILRKRDESGRFRKSDEAEYHALLDALRCVSIQCESGDTACVRMDCRPVLNHIRCRKPPRAPRLRAVYDEIQEMIESLNSRGVFVELEWVCQKEMKQILGH